jgi:hypothetical protein
MAGVEPDALRDGTADGRLTTEWLARHIWRRRVMPAVGTSA